MEHGGRLVESEKNPDSPSSKQPKSDLEKKIAWEKLTAQYLNDLPRQLNEIRGMLEKTDFPAIKKHAHRAKGTSATYKLNSISENFVQLESLAENRNRETIADTINKIMRLVETETDRLNTSKEPSAENSGRNING